LDRDKALGLLHSPLTGNAQADESVEHVPQGDTIGIILIFRVAKAVIVALIIAANVQAIISSGNQVTPPPAALSDLDKDSPLSNSMAWNATYVAESIHSFDSKTDVKIVISTVICLLLAALSGCTEMDKCLESDSILEGFSISNFTKLLSTTIGKLNVILDTSALNATTLSGQFCRSLTISRIGESDGC
jgi:hypothetical protein